VVGDIVIRRRSDEQATALLMAQADKFRREDGPDKATALAMVAHELGHKPCGDRSMEHLLEWVEEYRQPTVHELAADALLDPYLEPEPPDGWHLIDNADADDVRHALEVAIERIRDVLSRPMTPPTIRAVLTGG
jgi:hypothetical protein